MRKKILISAAAMLAAVAVIFAVWRVQNPNIGAASSSHPEGTTQGLQKVDQKPVPTPTPTAGAEKKPENTASPLPVQSDPDDSKTGTNDAPVNATGSVRGTIVDVSTSSIIVRPENSDKELYFMRESAEVTGSLYVDSKVEVFYNGELTDNNSLDLYVTRIVVYPS